MSIMFLYTTLLCF